MKLRLFLWIIAFILPLVGVWAAARFNLTDGGLGGALGIATTFLIYLSNPNKTEKIFREIWDKLPKEEELSQQSDEKKAKLENLQAQIELIISRITVTEKKQEKQNILLAIASIEGTLIWAIGNPIAIWIRTYHHTWM